MIKPKTEKKLITYSLTSAEKKKFIRDMCNSMRDELLKKVDNMPEEWDGIELRQLLGDVFRVQGSIVKSFYFNDKYEYNADRRRFKAYKNEVLVRNLV